MMYARCGRPFIDDRRLPTEFDVERPLGIRAGAGETVYQARVADGHFLIRRKAAPNTIKIATVRACRWFAHTAST
jgi:hypothetical protein